MFSLAIKYNKVRSNPCRDVQRFRPDNIRIRYFSYDEEERLLLNAQTSEPYSTDNQFGNRHGDAPWGDSETHQTATRL
jgi:hypothetical protein